MLIAQMTDLHVCRAGELCYDRVDTSAMVAEAVATLARYRPRPDLVLLTGDLVDRGIDAEYEQLRSLLAPLDMPLFLIPGNHDNREAIRRNFPDHAYLPRDGTFLHYTVEDHPLRLIALDTTIGGSHRGLFCAQRAAWLEERLQEQPDRPTVIFMHHVPFPTGVAAMDRYALDGREDFVGVVSRHPQIERVLCGHLHRPLQFRVGGTVASSAPSVVHQVALDLHPEGAEAFVMEPPAFQLHQWIRGAGLVSHTAYVRRYSDWYGYDGVPVADTARGGTAALSGHSSKSSAQERAG